MREPAWGLLIVVYLFAGGLSAGAMMISAAALLVGRGDRSQRIARVGALCAPLPVIVGTALLVFDLGRPFFFWKLFVAFRPASVMWIGSWLLAVFSLLSVAYAYLHLPERWQRWPSSDAAVWRRRLAIAGLPLGVAVAVYTAVLLGVLVARPLWNTPLLSMLFLVSALSSAAGMLMLLVPPDEQHRLSTADVALLGVELAVMAALLVFGTQSTPSVHDAIRVLAGGQQAALFWLGVILLGLVVPLGVETAVTRRTPYGGHLTVIAASLVVFGGFLLRYVIVYAGQASALG